MTSNRRRVLLAIVGVLAIALGSQCHVTRLRLNYPSGEVTTQEDIPYREGSSDPKHQLDLFMPAGAKAVPMVLFLHGGYWVSGDRQHRRPVTGLYSSVGIALAKQGIGAVVPSYRLAPGATIDDILDDVLAALRWTEEHAAERGGDPQQIFVMGHSAGGHLAALISSDASLHTMRGMDHARIRGCISISAIWDIVDMHRTQDAAFHEDVTYPVFGTDAQHYPHYSPLTHLAASTPPMLVLVGERDFPYLLPQARSAVDKLRAAGGAPRLEELRGNSHIDMVLRFGAQDENLTALVAEFVRQRSVDAARGE